MPKEKSTRAKKKKGGDVMRKGRTNKNVEGPVEFQEQTTMETSTNNGFEGEMDVSPRDEPSGFRMENSRETIRLYPGLDLSDEEMEQIRNNKGSRDDNWNPKARVHVSGVKGERPHREGVKKEAIEQVLAAAAAKPVPSKPKKPRKRLKSESFSESDASNTPGTALSSSAPGSAFRPNLVKPVCPQGEMSSPIKAKKPKKGLATAKQRLGKILKINKLGMF